MRTSRTPTSRHLHTPGPAKPSCRTVAEPKDIPGKPRDHKMRGTPKVRRTARWPGIGTKRWTIANGGARWAMARLPATRTTVRRLRSLRVRLRAKGEIAGLARRRLEHAIRPGQ